MSVKKYGWSAIPKSTVEHLVYNNEGDVVALKLKKGTRVFVIQTNIRRAFTCKEQNKKEV